VYEVLVHTVLAAEHGQFGVADVVRGIDAKLRSRHPHVFGDVVAGSSDEVLANWEQIKKVEKNRSSVMEGIPRGLPALLYALKVQKKAEGAGYVDPARAPAPSGSDREVADLLLDAVALARARDIDPEDALRRAADAYRERFQQFERASM
jgi:uncharacterized protein YabN with tetrapyrrole methylase and pyrophosphatase domain